MKTRLLLLLLLAFSYLNAQVTAGLLQEFRFDNSYTNQNADVTFSNNNKLPRGRAHEVLE